MEFVSDDWIPLPVNVNLGLVIQMNDHHILEGISRPSMVCMCMNHDFVLVLYFCV